MLTNLIFNLINGPIESALVILFEARINPTAGSLAFRLAFMPHPELRLE